MKKTEKSINPRIHWPLALIPLAVLVLLPVLVISIVLTGNIYKKLFHEKGFEGRLLSRSTEDSATVTSVLVPWNTCGMTQSLVLHVPTMVYLPYCFFNILSPLMSIFIAMQGYRIFCEEKKDIIRTGNEEDI